MVPAENCRSSLPMSTPDRSPGPDYGHKRRVESSRFHLRPDISQLWWTNSDRYAAAAIAWFRLPLPHSDFRLDRGRLAAIRESKLVFPLDLRLVLLRDRIRANHDLHDRRHRCAGRD